MKKTILILLATVSLAQAQLKVSQYPRLNSPTLSNQAKMLLLGANTNLAVPTNYSIELPEYLGGSNVFRLSPETLFNNDGVLSNMLWNLPNNSVLLLGAGTFTNNTFNTAVSSGLDGTGVAPLQLRNKTNIVIRGTGRDTTRIISTVTNYSALLTISNCNHIKLLDISFEGTRDSDPQNTIRGVNSPLISVCGNNSYVEVGNCTIKNFMGQGMWDFGADVHTNNYFYIHDNYSTLIGTTNAAAAAWDGVTFPIYPNSVYANNTFENLNRAFENEDAHSIQTGNGVLIVNNVIKNPWDTGIYLITDNNTGAGSISNSGQVSIIGNLIMGTNTPGDFITHHVGLNIAGGKNFVISGNQIHGFTYGMELDVTSPATNLENVTITDNNIAKCYVPIFVNAFSSGVFPTRDFIISKNNFNDSQGGLIFGPISNLRLTDNKFVNNGTVSGEGIHFYPFTSGTFVSSNIVISGNDFYNNSGTTASGIIISNNIRNVKILNNWFGPGITTPLVMENDGMIDIDIQGQTTSATPVTFLSINQPTNSIGFYTIEASGVQVPAAGAASLILQATFRNTNGFMSNIVASAVHTYIYTNATDSTWYVDVTNTGTKVLNFVAASASSKTVNWQLKCKANIIK